MLWLKYLEKYLRDKLTGYHDYFHIAFADAYWKPVFLGGFDLEVPACVPRSVLNTDPVPWVSLRWWSGGAYLGSVKSSVHELECAHRREGQRWGIWL